MNLAIMIEGQHGLTWERLQRLAPAVEELGFYGLYRSDHFTNPEPPNLPALELWVSLTWLASHTTRLQFGPLVAPVSFRDPVMLARMAGAVADLSGRRLTLGLGAGWQAREHSMFGYELLDVPARFARFTEALEITTRLLRDPAPVTFGGDYYQLADAELLPRPAQPGQPPILIGGNGPQRTLPLAARYADEWNAVFVPPVRFRELSAQLDALAQTAGRDPRTIRRSLMTGLCWAPDDATLGQRLAGRSADELHERGMLVGTSGAVVEQLGALADAGVAAVMVQWLDLDDLDGLATFAQAVLPQLR